MFFRLRRLFKTTGREIAMLWYACRHPTTPISIKLGALLLAIYVISPIDFISDMLPILGWIDDVALLAFGIPALLKLVPAPARHDAGAATDRFLSRWRFWRTKT